MSVGKRSKRDVNKNRKTVFKRDNYTCVVTGSEYEYTWGCYGIPTIQHRVTRGMGGSNAHDEPRDLVTMCAYHNQLETMSATFRRVCELSGWSVRRSMASQWPLNRVPVLYGSDWFLLDGDARFLIPEEVAVELIEEMYDSKHF